LTFKTKLAATTTAVALALSTPFAAVAQDTDQAGQQMKPGDVTDEKVSAFVEALVAVDGVRNTYGPKIEAEDSEEAKQELVNEANSAIVQAVDSIDGMSVDQYTSILQLAQADEDLNQKIMSEIKSMQN